MASRAYPIILGSASSGYPAASFPTTVKLLILSRVVVCFNEAATGQHQAVT